MNPIQWAFPGWALRRQEARTRPATHAAVSPLLGGDAYVGASNRKTMSEWQTTRADADTALLPSLPTLRERSRDLYPPTVRVPSRCTTTSPSARRRTTSFPRISICAGRRSTSMAGSCTCRVPETPERDGGTDMAPPWVRKC